MNLEPQCKSRQSYQLTSLSCPPPLHPPQNSSNGEGEVRGILNFPLPVFIPWGRAPLQWRRWITLLHANLRSKEIQSFTFPVTSHPKQRLNLEFKNSYLSFSCVNTPLNKGRRALCFGLAIVIRFSWPTFPCRYIVTDVLVHRKAVLLAIVHGKTIFFVALKLWKKNA